MKVIGLMSGTSADGVDAALVDIRGAGHDLKLSLLAHRTFPYPAEFRVRLLEAMASGTVADVCHLNAALGEWFARAALRLLKSARVSPRKVALIGSHGQTLHHLPGPRRESRIGAVRSTLQLGEPVVIAERTGITTVAGFRTRDMAVGGEGAPLTPYLHHLLFHQASLARVVVNIGGISNLTYLPARGGLGAVRAFDTGPGCAMIDDLALRHTGKPCDEDGALAAAGRADDGLVREADRVRLEALEQELRRAALFGRHARIVDVDEDVGVNERGHDRTGPLGSSLGPGPRPRSVPPRVPAAVRALVRTA